MRHEEILTLGFRRIAQDQPEKLWYIDDVPNGSDCGCVCPHCREKLIARNEGRHNIHHFAHVSGKTCKGARMSSLHALAQEVIKEECQVMLPAYKGKFVQHDAKLQVFDDVTLEELCTDEVSRRRPDCIGKVLSDGIEIWVEIYCTNPINEERRADIIRRKQHCIEIDFSDLLNTDYTKESVRERLLNKSNDRKWICHPEWDKEEEEKIKQEIEREEKQKSILEALKKNEYKIIQESQPEAHVPQFTGNTIEYTETWGISRPNDIYTPSVPKTHEKTDWLMWIKTIYFKEDGEKQFYETLEKEYTKVNFKDSHPFVVNDAETKINELLVAITIHNIAMVNKRYLEFLIVLRVIDFLNRIAEHDLGRIFVKNESLRNTVLRIIGQLQSVTNIVSEQRIKAMPAFQNAENKETIMQILTICNIVK